MSSYHKYDTSPKGRFRSGKSQAKKRGIPWQLTLDEYVKILTDTCHYCGCFLAHTGSGLDRKDNALGYTAENCIPCCKRCNNIKGPDLTYREMKLFIAVLNLVREA